MTVTELGTIIVAAVSAISSIGAIVFAFKKTTTELDTKNIESFKTRVGLLEAEKEDIKKRLIVCEGLHRDNLQEKGKLQGVVETMERVLENRDPKLQEALAAILKFMERIETHMQTDNTLS